MKRARSTSNPTSLRLAKRLKTKTTLEEEENSFSQPEVVSSPTSSFSIPPPAEEEPQCGICYEKVEVQGILDSCKHFFCFDCIFKWSETSNTCPFCKGRFYSLAKHDRTKGGKPNEVLEIHKKDAYFSDEEDYSPTEEDLLEDSIANFLFRFFPRAAREEYDYDEDEDSDLDEDGDTEEYEVNVLFHENPLGSWFHPRAIPIFLNYGPRRPILPSNQPPVVIDLTQDSDNEDETETSRNSETPPSTTLHNHLHQQHHQTHHHYHTPSSFSFLAPPPHVLPPIPPPVTLAFRPSSNSSLPVHPPYTQWVPPAPPTNPLPLPSLTQNLSFPSLPSPINSRPPTILPIPHPSNSWWNGSLLQSFSSPIILPPPVMPINLISSNDPTQPFTFSPALPRHRTPNNRGNR